MLRSMIPWRESLPSTLPRFENEVHDLMERFFGDGGEHWGLARFSPSLNLSETEDGYQISVELAGVAPEDVKVELNDGNLWISGEKKEEEEETDKTFHRVERRHGEFHRMIRLPGAVDEDNVEAKFEHGVLNVVVPKSDRVKPKRIKVST